MDIKDRLVKAAQGEMESIIHLGGIVEKTMLGDMGAILEALFEGMKNEELRRNLDGKLSSDRVLGRIEIFALITTALEQYVIDKDNLTKELIEDNKSTMGTAEEPIPY